MSKNRLESFSDGVIAVIITIMVLEMKVPHGVTFQALAPLTPVFLTYVLSFVYLGIYWNNHHHMLHTCEKVTGAILWANLHLLFWLSLIPFTTGWMGENHFAAIPVGPLWGGSAHGSYRLFYLATVDHRLAGPRFALEKGDWQRLEGQVIAGPLSRGHPGGVLVALGGARHLCLSRPDLADPGSAHRENAGEPGKMTCGSPGFEPGVPLGPTCH